jgi:hypothetical protein
LAGRAIRRAEGRVSLTSANAPVRVPQRDPQPTVVGPRMTYRDQISRV